MLEEGPLWVVTPKPSFKLQPQLKKHYDFHSYVYRVQELFEPGTTLICQPVCTRNSLSAASSYSCQ